MRASARSADDARTRATVAATALQIEAMWRSEWGGSAEEGGILKRRARRPSNNSECEAVSVRDGKARRVAKIKTTE